MDLPVLLFNPSSYPTIFMMMVHHMAWGGEAGREKRSSLHTTAVAVDVLFFQVTSVMWCSFQNLWSQFPPTQFTPRIVMLYRMWSLFFYLGISFERFVGFHMSTLSHVLNALCKIYNWKLQSLSYFAIRPTNIVQICESTLYSYCHFTEW